MVTLGRYEELHSSHLLNGCSADDLLIVLWEIYH